MSWQDVGVLVAMVGVIGGFALTWRGQGQDKRLAEASAERSEAAARLSADNTERVVAALEEIALKDFTANIRAGSSSPEPRVRWSMRHFQGARYAVENVGDAVAHDVHLEAHESLGPLSSITGGPDLSPGEAMTFMAAPDMGTSDMTVTVSWRDDATSTILREWKYPLPPGH